MLRHRGVFDGLQIEEVRGQAPIATSEASRRGIHTHTHTPSFARSHLHRSSLPLSQLLLPPLLEGLKLEVEKGGRVVKTFSPSPMEAPFGFLRAGAEAVPDADDQAFLQASRQAQSQGSSAQRELGAAEALTEVLLQSLGSEEEDEAEPSFTADVVPGFISMLVDIIVVTKDQALLR